MKIHSDGAELLDADGQTDIYYEFSSHFSQFYDNA